MTTDRSLIFDERGLLPAIVQDWKDGTVLMLGYMNEEALSRTLRTRRVHFWSRSRNTLWEKGETSGHHLTVKDCFVDCDHDTILVKVGAAGPTCHTGERSCFFTPMEEAGIGESHGGQDAWGGIVDRVYRTILDRKRTSKKDSYVSALLEGGIDRIAKKVIEEAGEVVIASKNDVQQDVVREAADLIFHLLVLLAQRGITPQDLYEELAQRSGKSGLRQKQLKAETRP